MLLEYQGILAVMARIPVVECAGPSPTRLALGVVKSHRGVPFSGGISPNASVMRGGLGDAGPEGVEIVDYH